MSIEKAENLTDSQKFDNFIKPKIKPDKRVAIFTHPTPDPDAVGSMRGLQHLLYQVYNVESDLFYSGEISHPQNKNTVNLLDSHLQKADDYKSDSYFANILVDTVPSNAGIGKNPVSFDVVIDHHKDLVVNGGFNGLLIHHHTGSCCGVIYQMLKELGLDKFENEERAKIATSLLVGVITDTNFCLSEDTTTLDFTAHQELYRWRDADALRKIVHYNRPISWIKLLGVAINELEIEDGIAVVGLGHSLTDNMRDIISYVASEMVHWNSIQTAVVFALFEGERIEGSVRTSNDTIEVHSICQKLGGKLGSGGGKSCKGGYRKMLGDMSIELEEDESIQEELWKIIKKREISKIFRILKK